MTKVRQKREEFTMRSQSANSIETAPKTAALPKTFQLKQMTEQDCEDNNDDKLAKVKHHFNVYNII